MTSVRAELYWPEEPEIVVAVAIWDGTDAHILPNDDPPGLDAILRPTPIVVDDPALRGAGTHGETVLQPGTFEWFRSALVARGSELGLAVRFVPGVREGGWDPASQYRTFDQQVGRLTSSGD